MSVSDAKRKANAKWDSENMSTMSCKIKKTQAEAFKAYCEASGKTPNSVIRDFILDCIGSPPTRGEMSGDDAE